MDTQEHLPIRARGTRVLKISQYGFARLAQQWKLGVRVGLRVAHAKHIASPVDIFQAQPHDLRSPHTVSRQQHQDCVIAQTGCGAILSSHFQHFLHLLLAQGRGSVLVLIDARSDHRTAEISDDPSAAVQMAQEVSETHGAVFDGSTSQPAATLLYVSINVVNAQACEPRVICTCSKRRQESHRLSRALGSRLRAQPAQIAQPRVVVLHGIAVKSLENRSRWIYKWPRSMSRCQQYAKGTGESPAPFMKRRRFSMSLTE